MDSVCGGPWLNCSTRAIVIQSALSGDNMFSRSHSLYSTEDMSSQILDEPNYFN